MEDITRRLRLSTDADDVERERTLAVSIYRAATDTDQRLGQEEMRRIAKRSIEAACVFWEEWDIAVLTPDVSAPAPIITGEKQEGAEA